MSFQMDKLDLVIACGQSLGWGGGKLPLPHTQTHREMLQEERLYNFQTPTVSKQRNRRGKHTPGPQRWRAGRSDSSPPPCGPACSSCRPGCRPEPGWPWSRWPLQCRSQSGEDKRGKNENTHKKKNCTQYKPQGQQMKLALGRGPLQLVYSLAGHEINKPRFRRFVVVIVWNCVRVCSRDGREDNPRLVGCEIEFCNCEWEREGQRINAPAHVIEQASSSIEKAVQFAGNENKRDDNDDNVRARKSFYQCVLGFYRTLKPNIFCRRL